ncbi:MAG: transglutaminase-like cysteine peptidase [Campylobacterota bacterium]|nr:transglutaminase-like cysteine peptidase [Campylobacterota bacterium]
MLNLSIKFGLISSILALILIGSTTYNISQEQLAKIEKKYGPRAKKRVLMWDKMLLNAKNKSTLKKLKIVNDFFNQIRYKRDHIHWKKKDYWASPFEFMGSGAGDCEDYAIAKYFALRQLGVPDEKLKITYVKLTQRKTKYEEAHMVLNYYHKPDRVPIVLDNVNKKLKLATARKDLKPVYSFNAVGLWKAQNKGRTNQKVGANNLKNWQSLMQRI